MSDQLIQWILLANVSSTFALIGLIWFVQVVHYPQFRCVGEERFPAYEAAHVRSTTHVVALPMLMEAFTSILLAWRPPSPEVSIACWMGLTLVIVIWLSTIMVQVPKHKALKTSFNPKAHSELVRSNWIRTISWTLRGGLCLYMLNVLVGKGLYHGQ